MFADKSCPRILKATSTLKFGASIRIDTFSVTHHKNYIFISRSVITSNFANVCRMKVSAQTGYITTSVYVASWIFTLLIDSVLADYLVKARAVALIGHKRFFWCKTVDLLQQSRKKNAKRKQLYVYLLLHYHSRQESAIWTQTLNQHTSKHALSTNRYNSTPSAARRYTTLIRTLRVF
jgi:hypothetical protein